MNFVTKWIIEWRMKGMLTKAFDSVDGYKTYITAAVGVVAALVSHFYGPIQIGKDVLIPQVSWSGFFDILWNGALFGAVRNGISKFQK